MLIVTWYKQRHFYTSSWWAVTLATTTACDETKWSVLRHGKGPFTLRVSVNTAMSLTIYFRLNCLDFFMNQANHSQNGLQPQLIRYDASVDADAPNQSWTLSVNETLKVCALCTLASSVCQRCNDVSVRKAIYSKDWLQPQLIWIVSN